MRYYLPGICGYGLSFQLDGFRMVFALLAVLAVAACALLRKKILQKS